eukprot:3443968-Heterocapsa_arctica.AAC.1
MAPARRRASRMYGPLSSFRTAGRGDHVWALKKSRDHTSAEANRSLRPCAMQGAPKMRLAKGA